MLDDDRDASDTRSDEAWEPAAEPPLMPEAEAQGDGNPGAADARGNESTQDYKDRWLRAEADLQNYRRRAQRDRDDSVQRAEDRLLVDVLGVLDDLERALASLPAGEPWAQGVALTANRLNALLASYGVTRTESHGRPFDPNVHDALAEVEPPAGIPPGAVAQEISKGYRRGERALRAARVVVARADADR